MCACKGRDLEGERERGERRESAHVFLVRRDDWFFFFAVAFDSGDRDKLFVFGTDPTVLYTHTCVYTVDPAYCAGKKVRGAFLAFTVYV